MAEPGSVIQAYLDATFGRFIHLRPEVDPPLTPWTPPPAEGLDRVVEHLTDRYGVPVKKLEPLDCGVYRVDRADRSSWIARVFPPARMMSAVEGDAEILSMLETRGFPSERLADEDPVSAVDGHAVVVTLFVKGKPPSGAAAMGTWQGNALGELHAIPLDEVPSRLGGGWHSLSLNGGGRAADLGIVSDLFADLKRLVAPEQRAHVDTLLTALGSLDLCEGLPQALVHVDFGGPNILKAADGSMTVIDWTGAGRGPRVESVASAFGPLPPAAQKAAIKAYREHIELTPEELDRLEGTLLTHQLVLACWGAAVVPAQLPGVAAQVPKAPAAMQDIAARMRKAFAAASPATL